MDFLREVRRRVIFFDGAMGTMLQSMGLSGGDCPEEWNVTHPDALKRVHEGYVEAGSDVIETNTFGGSRFKLERYGKGDMVLELNRAGARLAKEVAGDRAIVAGSVGPTGEFLEPLGTVSEDEMLSTFREQAAALAEGGVDIFCIETMSDLREAELAVRAAKVETGLPVAATMAFNPDPRGFRTMMGVSPEEACRVLLDAGADVVGVNCGGIGIVDMARLVGEMRTYTDAPILAQPNAGVPQLIEGKAVFSDPPELMARHAPELVSAGADIIGGCCGTTPRHIKAMIDAVKRTLGIPES